MFDDIHEQVKILQAFADGKTIEFREHIDASNEWYDVVGSKVNWNWNRFDYRIKAIPQYVPFDNNDFLVGMILTPKKMKATKITILSQNHYGVYLSSTGTSDFDHPCVWVSFSDLYDDYYVVYHNKDNHPCGKVRSNG